MILRSITQHVREQNWFAANLGVLIGVIFVVVELNQANRIVAYSAESTRRTRLARLFPNEASCLRLVSAVLIQISEVWQIAEKRYVIFDEK